MLPLIMAAVNLLQKKQQDQQNAQNGRVNTLENEANELGGKSGGQPQTFARGATKESAGQSGLGSILGTLGSLKGNGNAPDMSAVKQSNGVNADPLSYGSVSALNGIGVNGQNAPNNEDLLSDY